MRSVVHLRSLFPYTCIKWIVVYTQQRAMLVCVGAVRMAERVQGFGIGKAMKHP